MIRAHAPVPDRYEIDLPACVLLLEQGDRVGAVAGRLPAGV